MYKGEGPIKAGPRAGIKTQECRQQPETRRGSSDFHRVSDGDEVGSHSECQAVVSGQAIHLGYFKLSLDVAATGI